MRNGPQAGFVLPAGPGSLGAWARCNRGELLQGIRRERFMVVFWDGVSRYSTTRTAQSKQSLTCLATPARPPTRTSRPFAQQSLRVFVYSLVGARRAFWHAHTASFHCFWAQAASPLHVRPSARRRLSGPYRLDSSSIQRFLCMSCADTYVHMYVSMYCTQPWTYAVTYSYSNLWDRCVGTPYVCVYISGQAEGQRKERTDWEEGHLPMRNGGESTIPHAKGALAEMGCVDPPRRREAHKSIPL